MNYFDNLNTFAPEDLPEFLSDEELSELALLREIDELCKALEEADSE